MNEHLISIVMSCVLLSKTNTFDVESSLYKVNHDPRPFADDTPETVGDLTAEQVLLERSSELSWNVDGLSADVFNDTKGPVPITPFVHDVLPQVSRVSGDLSPSEALSTTKRFYSLIHGVGRAFWTTWSHPQSKLTLNDCDDR